MKKLVALALVACSSSARTPEPSRPVPTSSGVQAQAPDVEKPVPTVHAKHDVREAPHGGAIQTLAISPDGVSALSADELGGVRLWPSLDGTQEPRIVDMPIARQLAVGRVAGGYSAVARDEAGGLYLAKLDETGRQVSHTTLPAEPPVAGMAMTSAGLLAWRTDQILVLLDADGAAKDKLGTEPQQRIVAVAVNGKRALVVLEREGEKQQARWLQLEPKLAWGSWVKLGGDLTGVVELALSPSGTRVAALTVPPPPPNARSAAAGNLAIYEIAKHKPMFSEPAAAVGFDLAFADDDHFVIGGLSGLAWYDLTQSKPKVSPTTSISAGTRVLPALAGGGGHAISASNGDLVIATPAKTVYLGYDTVAPRLAEVGPDGKLLVGVGDHLLLLDKDLRGGSAPFADLKGMTAELRWLGDGDWLVEGTSPTDGAMQIAIVDEHGANVARKGLKDVQILSYEPSTQLVTMSFGAESEVARFDRKTKKLERIAGIKKPSPYEQVMFVPVSPSLARGTQLIQITMRDRTTVKWLRDPSALDKPSATVTVDGPFAGADAAGNVYLWRNTPGGQLELAIYADGKPRRTLPNTGAVALWPDPSGKRYIEAAPSSVALYDVAGKQLWFQQLATSQEALWLTDGSIALTSAGGIARLDPATGAVTAARCGWRFGLGAKPHPPTPRVEPLCSQLHR